MIVVCVLIVYWLSSLLMKCSVWGLDGELMWNFESRLVMIVLLLFV